MCQSEAEFLGSQVQKKSRVLSNYLCRRPVNVIIQKSSTKFVPKDEEKNKDADVFLTKIGPEDYNFLDEDVMTDSGSSTEARKIDQESLN